MSNYSSCPNCGRDTENLDIYKCKACHKEYCKYCSGGSRPTVVHKSCTSTSYKSATLPITVGSVKVQSHNNTNNTSSTDDDDDISWWEFGHSNEFFLKSLLMLPIRLSVYIVLAIFSLTIGLPLMIIFSIVIILISIFILMPIKSVLYIISFGHWNFFENRFINKAKDLWTGDL